MTDTLAAADGAALAPLLLVGLLATAVLVTARLARETAATAADLAEAGELPGGSRAGLLLAVLAPGAGLLLPPAAAVGVAACLMLLHVAFVNAAARAGSPNPVCAACFGLGLSVVLAVNISVVALVVAAGVVVLGGALTTLCARSGHPR